MAVMSMHWHASPATYTSAQPGWMRWFPQSYFDCGFAARRTNEKRIGRRIAQIQSARAHVPRLRIDVQQPVRAGGLAAFDHFAIGGQERARAPPRRGRRAPED